MICIYTLVRVNDPGVKVPFLQSITIVSEFPEDFPDDLPRVRPERQIDFGINVVQNTHLISIPP